MSIQIVLKVPPFTRLFDVGLADDTLVTFPRRCRKCSLEDRKCYLTVTVSMTTMTNASPAYMRYTSYVYVIFRNGVRVTVNVPEKPNR